jgi:multisubunit Na+/H+ antiporter MnhB subunit
VSEPIAFLITAGLVLLVYFLVLEDLSLRRRKRVGWDFGKRQARWQDLVAALLIMACASALFLVAIALLSTHKRKPAHAASAVGSGTRVAHLASRGLVGPSPFIFGAVVAVAFIVGVRLRRRSRKKGNVLRPLLRPGEPAVERSEALVAIDDSLDALMAEPDPRRAVIAAYARMERWLNYAGYGRQLWEAPFEHLDRVVVGLGATAAVGATLAGLYERAKFDNRPCGPDMKAQALQALADLRADLARRGPT